MRAQNFTKTALTREITLDDYELSLAVVQYIERQTGEAFEPSDITYWAGGIELATTIAKATSTSETKSRKARTVPVKEESDADTG